MSLEIDISKLNLNAGFLCFSTHWQPNPKDSNPNRPGQKMTMYSYIPLRSTDICLCGSGKIYSACCQTKRYWHPVCPNPGMKSYSLLVPQSATFSPVDGDKLRKQLMTDKRLHCSEDRRERSFWNFWGFPPVEDQYGILCFGDIELRENRTLLVTAMSDLRMDISLNILKEITGDSLGKPKIAYDKILLIDKLTHKSRFLK